VTPIPLLRRQHARAASHISMSTETTKAGQASDWRIRRPHRKTRTGCNQCKRRRVKVRIRFLYLEPPPSFDFPQIKYQRLTKGHYSAALYSVMNEGRCAPIASAISCNADLHFSPPRRGEGCARRCCVPKTQMKFK
jgi:hypothetical protein